MQHLSRARNPRPAARAALVALLSVGTLGACQKQAENKDEAKPTAAAKPAAEKAQPAAKKPALKRLEWDDPKQWKKVPPSSSMRIASYQIPPAPGDKEIAEMNVFVLGGDIESNIQRWIDEFSAFDPRTLSRVDRVVNDMTQAVVEIPKGTFSGGMGDDSPSDDFGLLGGIVVTPEEAKYFFKLTGPSATVRAARDVFYGLLDSVRLEGGTAAPDTAKTIKTVGGPAAPPPPDPVAPKGESQPTTAPAAAKP